jgi:hypothetical protein
MRTMRDIESKINQLTPGLIEELDRYLDYLVNKRVVRKPWKTSSGLGWGFERY